MVRFYIVVENLAKEILKSRKGQKHSDLSKWPSFALQILKFPYEIKKGGESRNEPNIFK